MGERMQFTPTNNPKILNEDVLFNPQNSENLDSKQK